GDRSGLRPLPDYYALCWLLPPGQDRSLDPQSGMPDQRQISHWPARPTPYASHPVLIHRLARLLHASFRPSVAGTPLRFAMTSPPSGCKGTFTPELSNILGTPKKKEGNLIPLLETIQ